MLLQEMTPERAKELIDQSLDLAVKKLSENRPIAIEMAEVIVKQILRCDPEHLRALQLLGLVKYRLDRYIEAIEIFNTALDIDPTDPSNYNNIALCYGQLDYKDRALANHKRAVELAPNDPMFHNNLALAYRSNGDYDNAIKSINKSIELFPNAQAYVNLDGLYGEMGRLDESLAAANKALEFDPNFPPAHVDKAFSYFRKGEWETGWKEYEWRFELFEQLQHYVNEYDQTKKWNGQDSLEGKRILVYCEQGLGDGLMCARYFKELKQRGAYVIVNCNRLLDRLFSRVEGVDEVTFVDIMNPKHPALPEYDYQCSSFSLPNLLKSYELCGKPYMTAATDKFRVEVLEKEYGTDDVKIGMIWAGSPSHPHDRQRSVPLKNFKALLQTPRTKFFSLQKDLAPRSYGQGFSKVVQGKTVDYNEDCDDIKLTDLTTMIQCFEDTATIISGLDLVITCDTAIVHLAGALGVPCWVLVASNPDWRWGQEGETTDWYDSIRLFRQNIGESWTDVMPRVENALREFMLAKTTTPTMCGHIFSERPKALNDYLEEMPKSVYQTESKNETVLSNQ